MWVNKKMKLILLVVFTFGVSLGAPNATTQSNPPSQYNDVLTAVSTTGNHVKTTFGTDLLTSPKYPSSSNSGSSPFGQNGNRDTSITTPASSKTTTREMLRETTPCVRNSSANSKTKLVIGGFYSDGSGEWDGSGLREAVDLALRHVNEDPNILKKYDLDIEWKDTRCEAADGVWSFHSHLVEEPKKVMLLGPPCSPDAEPVAQTSERGNLVTVSYSAASPALSDRETHPYFFRTYKTDVIQNAPKVWLFNHFNWRRIGSIHQKRDLFTLVANIKVNVKEIFDKTPKTHQMAVMKDEDIKIILVGGYEESARELFCTAYKEGLHGPDYVWILPGWYNYHWYHNASSNCTEEEVVMTVEESLYISMEAANFSETPNNATVAGYTANEIKTQLEENWNKNANVTGLEMFGYDALWAIALALNQTEEVLAKEQYQDGCLENFNYNANDPKAKRMGYLLFKKMNATSFEGASGHVDLSHGDRHGLVNIEQLQPSCDKGWHLNNTSCYKFVKEKRNWIDSRQFCRDLAPERSSHLVSILSLSELSFLKGKTKGGSWYIGLTYDNFSDKLVWVDTKILGQKEWWPPSFDSAKETGSCYGWTVGSETWKPSDCSEEKKFICKRRAVYQACSSSEKIRCKSKIQLNVVNRFLIASSIKMEINRKDSSQRS